MYDEIHNRIRYLLHEKSGVTNSVNHNFERIRTDSHNSLPIEKILTFHNVINLIKSIIYKKKNHHYYNGFFKKDSRKDKSNTRTF